MSLPDFTLVMSGNWMTQNTVGESNPNIRLWVGFQILNHASKWIQDWSKQLVIVSDNKTTRSLGIDKLSQGWWNRHLRSKSFQFLPNMKLSTPGKRMIKIHVEAMEPVPGLQVRSSIENFKLEYSNRNAAAVCQILRTIQRRPLSLEKMSTVKVGGSRYNVFSPSSN